MESHGSPLKRAQAHLILGFTFSGLGGTKRGLGLPGPRRLRGGGTAESAYLQSLHSALRLRPAPPPPSSGCLLPGSPLRTPFLPSHPPMQPKGFLCQKKSGVPLPGPLRRIKTKLLTAQKAQRLASAHLSILISHDSCLSQTPENQFSESELLALLVMPAIPAAGNVLPPPSLSEKAYEAPQP